MKELIEEWKPISGYEDTYQVSNTGKVKGLKRNKVLKGQPNKNYQYLQVMLWNKSKAKLHYVHRLVAEAFVDNPNNYTIVRHLDGDVFNNNASNLEWASTPNYRNQYSK